ncbi:MAG: cytochrome b/b6 domain-containing protein [Pseudomonadota bacterium]
MKYTSLQVAYHWGTVMLVLVMAATGLAYYYEIGGDTPIVAHQVAGQLLILILVLRVVARISRRPGKTLNTHATWERVLASSTHIALYATLIVFVVTGYVSASALGEPTLLAPLSKAFARSDTGELLLEVHYAAKWVLLGLVLLHIAGALKHAVWDKDDTLSHMTFHRKGDFS